MLPLEATRQLALKANILAIGFDCWFVNKTVSKKNNKYTLQIYFRQTANFVVSYKNFRQTEICSGNDIYHFPDTRRKNNVIVTSYAL